MLVGKICSAVVGVDQRISSREDDKVGSYRTERENDDGFIVFMGKGHGYRDILKMYK